MDQHPGGAAPDAYGRLRVLVEHRPGGVVVRPEGELDHDTVEPLREALRAGANAGADLLVVDCAGLTFCDSTGLNLLLDTRSETDATNTGLVLAAPSGMVSRMLAISGTGAVFRICASVEEALATGSGAAEGADSAGEDPAGEGRTGGRA